MNKEKSPTGHSSLLCFTVSSILSINLLPFYNFVNIIANEFVLNLDVCKVFIKLFLFSSDFSTTTFLFILSLDRLFTGANFAL